MKNIIIFCTALLCAWSAAVPAQGFNPYADVYAKSDEARKNLRAAIIGLRDARTNSCRAGVRRDCDLADLSAVQVVLLDIGWRYARAARNVRPSELRDILEKVTSGADEAGHAVTEIEDLVDNLKNFLRN